MSVSLLPKIIADELPDVSPELLHSRGIRLLMLDFDNTVVPYTTDIPSQRVSSWLDSMKTSGIQLCIVSNSKKNRVPKFCAEQGMDCITHANKPFPGGIRRCLNKYGISPSQAALVGDQIFTDTLGANSAGVTSILVRAIHNHNFWLKARHVLEVPFIQLASNRRLKK